MAFDLEIAFSGLCLFTFEGGDSCSPHKCTVLMINACRNFPDKRCLPKSARPKAHEPRLIIPAENLILLGSSDANPDELVPGPDGEDHALWRLLGARVKLKPHSGEASPLLVLRNRKRGDYQHPDYEPSGDPTWFDWITNLGHIDDRLDGLVDDLTPDPELPVIATVQFSAGTLQTMELAQRHDDEMEFQFKTLNGCEADVEPRCLADRTVLRFKGLERPLKVRLERHRECQLFGIGPRSLYARNRKPVRASITNLDKDYNIARPILFDFLWYYEVFKWRCDPEPDLRDRFVPWVMGYRYAGRTPSTGTCPPGEG